MVSISKSFHHDVAFNTPSSENPARSGSVWFLSALRIIYRHVIRTTLFQARLQEAQNFDFADPALVIDLLSFHSFRYFFSFYLKFLIAHSVDLEKKNRAPICLLQKKKCAQALKPTCGLCPSSLPWRL